MRFQPRVVRRAPTNEGQPPAPDCHRRQFNLLAKKLLLGRSCGRRNSEGRAHLSRANLSRRRASFRDSASSALMRSSLPILVIAGLSSSFASITHGAFEIVVAIRYLHAEGTSQDSDPLEKLSDDFWTWRAKYAPFTGDDVNRMERPGEMRDWSRASINRRRNDLEQFESGRKKIDPSSWPIAKQVDYKLIGSALARVRWELDLNPRWKRDPNFYIEQTLTGLAEALTIPAPYDEARSREILTRIENIPSILQQGAENLEKPPAPFATVAINNLDGIRERLRKMASSLAASTTLNLEKLNSACEHAADALEKFQQQLKEKLPRLPQQTALGRDAYLFFLKNVALMPFAPEELLAMGRKEWNRAVAFEAYEQNRNKDVPPLKIADNIDAWIKDNAAKELQ